MSDDDAQLMAAAHDLLLAVYREGRHEVVAAFRMSDGSIVTGVHVDGSARRSAVCAEGVAAGNAIGRATGVTPEVVAAVSVLRRPGGSMHVIEPCGVCAELLSDYWPQARVWVTRGDDTVASTFGALLPAKRLRAW
jgi:cytidine deaminase